MPRSSVAKTRQHRAEIEAAAARLFREKGVDAVSVVDIMSAVGLTHGGFYKHFASKEHLAAAACSLAYRQTAEIRASWIKPDMLQNSKLEAFLTPYLSTWHRDLPGLGCPIVALAADTARQSEDAPMRDEYLSGLNEFIDEVASLLPPPLVGRPQALAATAMIVGALMISRTVKGSPLSEEILEAAKSFLLSQTH